MSNPATILSFVAVFGTLAGRGGTIAPGSMVLGVRVGSALWWIFLATAVGRPRTRFDSTWRRRINLASASVLAGFALWQSGSVLLKPVDRCLHMSCDQVAAIREP